MSTEQHLKDLAHKHYDRLFRAALFMSGDPDTAEDLVQETFLAAAQSLESFEGRSSHYTWLYAILLNKFRTWLRDKGGPASLDRRAEQIQAGNVAELVEDEGPRAFEQLARKETAALVRKTLDELPAHHRSVLALRFLDELSYEEVSEELDLPLGTVKSRIHYALQKIAEKLKQHEEEIS